MANFIVHNTTTGEIIRYGTCHTNDVSLQAGPNETVLPIEYQPGKVVNGVLVPLTADELEAQVKAERKVHLAELMAAKKRWAKLTA